MKLNLQERFTPEEITELRKRVFSFTEQLFLEGITVGRELVRENLYSDTEKAITRRISNMTKYLIEDDIWEKMPPHGYNPDPNAGLEEFDYAPEGGHVCGPDCNHDGTANHVDHTTGMQPPQEGQNMVNRTDEEPPAWASEIKPFK